MSLWLQILSCQLPAGPRRSWGPAFLVSLPLHLWSSSLSPPVSFSTVPNCHLLFRSVISYIILFLSPLSLLPSLYHLSPTWPWPSSSCCCSSLLSVLLTISGPLQRKISCHTNREYYGGFWQHNQNARMQNKKKIFFKSISPGRESHI